ncbi:MAG: lysine--tRNA ligase [Myxococcales bacterium]|nr:lysine--tRNA ligase [Myxococcales bacterium]
MAKADDLIASRRQHVEGLLRTGTMGYPNRFASNDEARARAFDMISTPALLARLPSEADLPSDALSYPMYGRVVAKRGPFLVLRTRHGDMQALVRKDGLSEDEAGQFAVVDLADHVAVEGPLMRTRTGDAAIRVLRYQHLSKSLFPPPEKWHGLTDIEKRYRERYVDLFANPEVAEVFRARSLIVAELRHFLESHHFLEVETPLLHAVRGGAIAKPFRTHHNALDMDLYLRIAPELYLKRLLVGGLERVYELGRCFRNEGISTRHNPEFTIMECYMAYANYAHLIPFTREMLTSVDAALTEHFPQLVQTRTFAIEEPWPEITLREAISDTLMRCTDGDVPRWKAVLNPEGVMDETCVHRACQEMMANLPDASQKQLKKIKSYGESIFFLFEHLAEPRLTSLYRATDAERSVPVFLKEYPFEASPLARRNDEDARWVDRFELYIEGREIANAFSELNDPDEQAARFQSQLELQRTGDDEAMDFDADYVRALSHGMPPAAGFGIGVDRLVMSLCGQPSIRDVLLFPLLKPETP